jgi:hypothetical protein
MQRSDSTFDDKPTRYSALGDARLNTRVAPRRVRVFSVLHTFEK